MRLTLFYDSRCPLCVREMKALKSKDVFDRIRLEDLHQPDFSARFPDLNVERVQAIFHGLRDDGQWFYGLDATHQAWSLVGRGWLTAPLRWAPLRPMTDRAYLWFARHRGRIGHWFGDPGDIDCERCRGGR
ncbi:thiol-disulfide oxidoreductase DCC family protein [Ferrimonas balearica]|uniref:thiol-disulfide oxidoreductase DCC family protein n=1 Tax=Ferrimonas balearica TaxID=44012 RepID=UPI001C991E27|nr:DUF393 domain-containing protein [Ferrimonas balearica]MBY5991195.1 DUF393 domain-containing protein [Ferrimonas balearica]